MRRTIVGVFSALLLGIVALGIFAVEDPVAQAAAQTTPAPNDPVIAGAGDIANSGAGDEATAKLLDSINPTVVYTTGDNAYPNGTLSEFRTYYEPTWGRHKVKTKPSPGNHEHHTSGASGYYDYFGAAAGERGKGYYSYDIGEWHLIALNSSISMGATSEQVGWLKNDLAAHTNACTLAYFHHPLFSSGDHGNQTQVKPLWDALYSANADVVLNGHDHSYERFAPQNPSGTLDTARGIREFVVGTGGASYYPFDIIKPNSEARSTGTHGVLKLTLHAGGYDWQFIPEAGKTFTDSGSDDCLTVENAAPTVDPNSLVPAKGAAGVLRTTNVSATFSEEMIADSLTSSTFNLQRYNKKRNRWKTIPATITLSNGNTTATLNPYGDTTTLLAANKKFRGLITTGARDLADNPLARNFIWTFTTGRG